MKMPGADIVEWLSPLGQAVRLMISAFSWQSIKNLSWQEIRGHCRWMGMESFFLVAFSAVLVAVALVVQCLIELQKYRIHDLAGAIISIGLLREIGPLTIGLAWCSRLSARISEEAHEYIGHSSETEFAHKFILPRYIAAVLMAIPLAAYGLVIGFLTGAFIAPLFSVSSTNSFLESAQLAVENKDIATYFIKLVLVFPLVAIFAGSACSILRAKPSTRVAIDAVTATFVSGFVGNLVITIALYCRY